VPSFLEFISCLTLWSSSSVKANSHSASKEIPYHLRNLKVHYRVQENPTRPYPEPDASSPHIPALFPQDPFKYYPTIYAQVFRMASSLQFFRPKFCMHFSWLPCVLDSSS